MRKSLLAIVAFMCAALAANAAPVTRQQAQQRASHFLALRGKTQTPLLVKQQARTDAFAAKDAASYYVFNASDGRGFVIVSGDDRTDDILGWSDSGTFDPQDIPVNMKAWLQGYADQIEWLDKKGIEKSQRTVLKAAQVHSSISPMLASLWNQTQPYNNLTPTYTQNSETKHCVTGCVATAMAQLMYFHRWPATSSALPGYSKGSYTLPALPATTFDWSTMYDTYANGEDGSEVAKLMLYCGQSVEMNYGSGSSEASTADAPARMAKYFGYDANYRILWRKDFFYDEWVNAIYNELAAGRPILFSGQSVGGGHAFICDGFAHDDYFHINWGWGGRSNGNFKLSLLAPHEQGAGGSSTSDGYDLQQYVVTGIRPDTGTPASVALSVSKLAPGETNVVRSNSSADFSVSVSQAPRNQTGGTYNFNVGIGIYKDNTLLNANHILSYELGDGYGWDDLSSTITFGSGLADGTYTIKAISRVDGTSQWMEDFNSEQYYITATISGNSCTLVPSRITNEKALTINSVTIGGARMQGEKTSVTFNVTNNGDYYVGDITMTFNGTKAGGTMVEMPAGETRDFTFEFTPKVSGSNILLVFYMGFYTNGTPIGTTTVDIAPSTYNTTDNIDLVMTREIINSDGPYVLGKNADVKITITNNSDQNYSGAYLIYTWVWNGGGSASGYSYPISVPHNSTVELTTESKELAGGEKYSISVGYLKNGSWVELTDLRYDYYNVADAYATYDTNGNKTMRRAVQSIDIAGDQLFVDLRGQDVVKTINSVANPNTLFLADPTHELNITKNVVVDGTAKKVEITDGYDFYTPETFTAQDITYTRTFTKGYRPGGFGWEAIMLPFDVEAVTVGGTEAIDWFRSGSDTGKRFWVMEFDDDSGSTIYYSHAAQMKKYCPYIISVPGDYWGSEFGLTGRPIVFSGTNAAIRANEFSRTEIGGSRYRFVGLQGNHDFSDIYALDAEGRYFTKGSHTVKSFHGYLAPYDYDAGSGTLFLSIAGQQPNGISDASCGTKAPTMYNLKGMRIDAKTSLPAGIYIINGKKVVK